MRESLRQQSSKRLPNTVTVYNESVTLIYRFVTFWNFFHTGNVEVRVIAAVQ